MTDLSGFDRPFVYSHRDKGDVTVLTLMVKLHVKPEKVDEFLIAMEANARASAKDEPGCLRFDVSRDLEDTSLIHLYEVYLEPA